MLFERLQYVEMFRVCLEKKVAFACKKKGGRAGGRDGRNNKK